MCVSVWPYEWGVLRKLGCKIDHLRETNKLDETYNHKNRILESNKKKYKLITQTHGSAE